MVDIFSNFISKTNPLGKQNKSYSPSDPAATSPAIKTEAAKTYIKNQTTPSTQSVINNPPVDNNIEKSNLIKSQIADLQKQADILNRNGLTDTSEISKNTNGNYEQNATGGYNKALGSYTDAFKKYIETLNPSQETIASQEAYNNYVAEQSKAVAGLEGKDAGVPISIVKGQQAKLLAQTQPEAARLQNAIGIAQGTQTARQNAGLAGVSLQEKLLGMQQSPAEQAKGNQVELGGVLYQKQDNGTYKPVAGNPKLDTSVVEVNGQKVLIDNQTGKTIKNLGGTTTGGVSNSGGYVQGTNPTIDAWAERIQNGTAKITDIPAAQAGLRNSVTVALQAMGNSTEGKPTTTELGKNTLQSANDLMKMLKEGKGTSAVGKSGLLGSFGYSLIPGTDRANFVNLYNNIIANQSLEGVKFLKGQGQVSDAERELLKNAMSKLKLSQSEEQFKKTLQDIIDKLEGNVQEDSNAGTTSSGIGYIIEQ